jgi:hypothetical protein
MSIGAAAVLGGSSLLGGYLQGKSAQNAANTSAQAQLQAAQIAADAAKFRPVGVTTRYGTSNFQTDAQGNLIGAGYNVSPELQQYQDQLRGLTQQQLQQGLYAPEQYAPLQGAAGGLFNLGQQYLAQSPEQAAQKYMDQQQALLAPSRERESALLANQLSNAGRTGLSVAQGGGLLSANPEQSALANARAMQDLQLAAGATQAGQQQTAFGAGLFGTGAGLLGQYQSGQVGALSPFQTSLGLGGTIEQMGQQGLEIGSSLGGRAATAGANVGQALLTGGLSAAKTAQAANAYNPLASALQGVGSNPYLAQGLGNWMSGTPSQYPYGGGGGGITSSAIQAPDMYNPYTTSTGGTGFLPVGYANL